MPRPACSLIFGQKLCNYRLDLFEIGIASLMCRRAIALMIFAAGMYIPNDPMLVDDETY